MMALHLHHMEMTMEPPTFEQMKANEHTLYNRILDRLPKGIANTDAPFFGNPSIGKRVINRYFAMRVQCSNPPMGKKTPSQLRLFIVPISVSDRDRYYNIHRDEGYLRCDTKRIIEVITEITREQIEIIKERKESHEKIVAAIVLESQAVFRDYQITPHSLSISKQEVNATIDLRNIPVDIYNQIKKLLEKYTDEY